MRINFVPPNGNPGVVPPWLTHPVAPTPITIQPWPLPDPQRGWWLDGDWDQPLTSQK